MSGRGVWSVLGIAPTTDEKIIRRAYAQALKQANPEDDAEGFQRLRAAYDAAMARARQPAGRIAPLTTIEPAAEPAADPVGLGIKIRIASAAQSAPEPAALAPSPTPSSPPPMAEEIALQAREVAAQKAEFDRRRQALQQRIADPGASEAALVEAFETVLVAPAMEMVGIHEETEQWLAAVIARQFPRTDPLVRPAIGRFGWSAERVGRTTHAVLAVLARARDLESARALSGRNHPQNLAFSSLRQSPILRRTVRYRLTLGLPAQAAELLEGIRTVRPGLGTFLNPEAVTWWQAYHAKPRLRPGAIWALVISLALATFALVVQAVAAPAYDGGSLRLLLVVALAVAAGVVGRLYLVDWPRALWQARWAAKAPAWQRLGWAPASLVMVMVSGLMPATAGLSTGLAVLAGALALWSTTTSDPNRGLSQASEIPHWRSVITLGIWILTRSSRSYPWQVRALASTVFPAVFLFASDAWLRPERQLQIAVATLGAAMAFVMGAGSLMQAWDGLASGRARWTSFAILAGAAAGAAALLSAYGVGAPVGSAATVCILSVFLAGRTAAEHLSNAWSGVRDLFMRFGWVPILLTVSQTSPDRRAGLLSAGVWLLGGVAITLAGTAVDLRKRLRQG